MIIRYFALFFILGSKSAVYFTLTAISIHRRLEATIMALRPSPVSTRFTCLGSRIHNFSHYMQ